MEDNMTTIPEKLDLLILQFSELKQQNLMFSKEVWSIEEVAMYTRLKIRFIYNLVARKAIPHYKPRGKMLYFKKTEIIDWLLQGRIATDVEMEQEAINNLVLGG